LSAFQLARRRISLTPATGARHDEFNESTIDR
jgi:hypothetical protein